MESGCPASDCHLLVVFCTFLLTAKALCCPLSQIEGLSLDTRILGESFGFLRTFGFLSRSVALWRRFAVRPSSTGLSPFFFPNNSYYTSYSSCRRTGMTQHQGIGIHVLELVAEVLGTPGKKWGG